jgi:hypothetical protein
MHPLLHPVSSSDFAHLKTDLGGVMGLRVAYGANRELVDLTVSGVLGNESKDAWMAMNSATKKNIPTFDRAPQTDVSDRDKGAEAALPESFDHVDGFYDYRHRKANILLRPTKKGGGKVAALLYEEAYKAVTVLELIAVKAKMSDKTKQYLSLVPDDKQYPVAAKLLHGHNNSSPVESGNNAMRIPREVVVTAMPMVVAEKIKSRFDENKAAALRHQLLLPPRVHKKMLSVRQLSAEYSTENVEVSADGKSALVQSLTNDTRKYRVQFEKIKDGGSEACDGGCSVLSGLPCEHADIAARKVSKTIESLQ